MNGVSEYIESGPGGYFCVVEVGEMEAIKCRLCGERHWGNCDFSANGSANGGILDDIAEVAPLKSLGKCLEKRGLYKVEDGGSSTYRGRDADKRRAYQREYMRKRRLK